MTQVCNAKPDSDRRSFHHLTRYHVFIRSYGRKPMENNTKKRGLELSAKSFIIIIIESINIKICFIPNSIQTHKRLKTKAKQNAIY